MEKEDRKIIMDLIASNLTIAAYLRDLYMKGGGDPVKKSEDVVKERYDRFKSELNK